MPACFSIYYTGKVFYSFIVSVLFLNLKNKLRLQKRGEDYRNLRGGRGMEEGRKIRGHVRVWFGILFSLSLESLYTFCHRISTWTSEGMKGDVVGLRGGVLSLTTDGPIQFWVTCCRMTESFTSLTFHCYWYTNN